MDRRISSSAIRDDHAVRRLLNYLEEREELGELGLDEAVFYYEFPLFRDIQRRKLVPQVMIVARNLGVAFISAPAPDDDVSEEISESLLELDSLLFSKLLKSPMLRAGRHASVVNIHCIMYGTGESREGIAMLPNDTAIADFLRANTTNALTDHQFESLISVVEGGTAITAATERDVADDTESKGGALKQLESQIANFDRDQRLAAIAVVDGPQRIRGLAGSGKTIILCMKAAQIHLREPESKIALTFYTRSLYELIKETITRFYREYSDADPDWSQIDILHAWGGRSRPGFYYNACVDNGIAPINLGEAKQRSLKPPFAFVCEQLLKKGPLNQVYDYVLIDEGQDMPAEFYRLCFAACKGGEFDRNIVWAYDDLQTIFDVRVQDVEHTFGMNDRGTTFVDLQRAQDELSKGLLPHDIVLKKSYRNSREILMLAHALGFGLYSDQIVQMLENQNHWEDLGYLVSEGTCVAGEAVVITRPAENSPISIADYTGGGEQIAHAVFDGVADEVDWVCACIDGFIADGLKPHDILVISLDDRNARMYFGEITRSLIDSDIKINNVLGDPVSGDQFFVEDHVTLSTVYRAKGNESAAVIIIGVDALFPTRKTISARNRLFTSISRAKAWLRLAGQGTAAQFFVDEVDRTLADLPEFRFTYPDLEEISTIQRDLTDRSAKLLELQQLALDLSLTDQEIDSLSTSIKKKK